MNDTRRAISIIANSGTRLWLDPIKLAGSLTASLFGLDLAHIELDLTISSATPQTLTEATARRGEREWSSMSRADLYRLAQERQIAGRSRMSRDELALAVAGSEEEADVPPRGRVPDGRLKNHPTG